MRKRTFLPNDLKIENFKSIEPFLQKLGKIELKSDQELLNWILAYSEVDAFLSEEMAWRYINYTRQTDNEEHSEAYSFFVKEVQPHLVKFENDLNIKQTDSEFFNNLPDNELLNYKRKAQLSLELFREENIPLDVEQSNLSQEYAAATGAMSIEFDGKELTMQQAGNILRDSDRQKRETIYKAINARRMQDKDALNSIFDKLTELRQQQANNCGFKNYRDFKHKALGRFDYSIEDVETFQKAVEKVAVPLQDILLKERKEALKIESLKPYDLQVNIYGSKPLSPFETGEELIDKAIECFDRIDGFFGETLRTMKQKGFVDLDSRKGKAPGGYNYPLDESGVPFIFMNATGSMRDVTTMVHEGGHAVHSVLTKDLKVNALKHCPSEVAELASMSMELISMDAWDVFFDNEKDLLRAKIEQLEGVLDVLPWIATVDKFQHWIYTHKNHSREEREKAWIEIFDTFGSDLIDYSEFEENKKIMWHKQLHIFEVPFYYIEYGIAQLGAIAVWKRYKNNPKQALAEYKAALALGYTKTIPEIYETAGIKFDFSEAYVSDLLEFVSDELQKLKEQFYALK